MNNNLYHWDAEQQVRYEMHEVDRQIEQARLLREAGLAGQGAPRWLIRAVNQLGNWLNVGRKGIQAARSLAPQQKAFARKSPRSV